MDELWLDDGRLARAELDEWDRPVLRLLTRADLRREALAAQGARERKRVGELAAEVRRIEYAARLARIKRNVSPEAFAEYKRRRTLPYILKKVWTAEKIQNQFHDASPFLGLLNDR